MSRKNKKTRRATAAANSNNYARRRRRKPKKNLFKKIILRLFLLGIFSGIIWVVVTFLSLGKIDEVSFYQQTSSVNIYDVNDKFVTTLTANNTRWVQLKNEEDVQEVSQDYIDGLIATEDANFYKHFGVDPIGVMRAAFVSLLGDSGGGASTITMQLAKLVYMVDWYTPTEANEGTPYQNKNIFYKLQYKLMQMLYAIKIDYEFTKEEILENYINTMYFGEPGTGIENASQYYFKVPAKDLKLHQAAMLAGVTQQPSAFNPYDYAESTQQRRDVVLGAMLEKEFITQEEHDAAVKLSINDGLVERGSQQANEEFFTGYVDQVRNELYANFADFDPSTASMDVYTFLEPTLQEEFFEIQHNPELYPDEKIQSGALTLDTFTGAIYAIASGRDVSGFGGVNFATNYTRQPGSTAKPIVAYAPAIEFLDWSTYHQLNDKAIYYTGMDDFKIANADGKFYGNMTMQKALSLSRNTTAIQTIQEVNQEFEMAQIQTFMSGLGISDIGQKADPENPDSPSTLTEGYSIGGWEYGTTPIEIAGAYAAFGNGGTFNEPHTIRKVDFKETSPYFETFGPNYDYEYTSEKAMKDQTAYLMTKALDLNNSGSYAASSALTSAQKVENQSAKTGTTEWGALDRADLVRDKWIVGYTNDFTTAVWTGYYHKDEIKLDSNDNVKSGYYVDKNDMTHAYLYSNFMIAADKNKNKLLHDAPKVEQPDNVEEKYIGDDFYYFIKSSDDYKTYVGGEVTSGALFVSNYNYSFSGQNLVVTAKSANKDVEYVLYAEGKEIETNETGKFEIPFSTFDACNKNVSIGLSVKDKTDESKILEFEVENQIYEACT